MGFEWLPTKNYKRHYICLACQKGFKRPSEKEMKHAESFNLSDVMPEYYAGHTEQDIVNYIAEAHTKLKAVCPNCDAHLIQVHYDFEVPSLGDNAAWKILRKTLAAKTSVDVTVYIQWHRMELEKVEENSAEYKLLQQNLQKLEAKKN